MPREVPRSKQTVVWFACGRWFLRRSSAYYAIAKRLVLAKYPRWLGDHDLDDDLHNLGETVGDFHASAEGITNWRRRRERREALFVRWVSGGYEEPGHEEFDSKRWQSFVWRVARFLMFVDDTRATAPARAAARVCEAWASAIPAVDPVTGEVKR